MLSKEPVQAFTDAHVLALVAHCPQLRVHDLSACSLVTEAALRVLVRVGTVPEEAVAHLLAAVAETPVLLIKRQRGSARCVGRG